MALDNKRIEETFRMMKFDTLTYKDHESVAQAADNIGRHDVAKWIRDNPVQYHIWIAMYAGVYDVPEEEEYWE